MVTSKSDLSTDQRAQLYTYFCELRDFFQITGAKHDRSSSARAQKARSKLLKLYPSQFFELSTDVHDELQRRIDENQTQPDHLLPKDSFHVKRNQARQKLANLSQSRFNDLVDDILYEIMRRSYHEPAESGDKLRNSAATDTLSQSKNSSIIGSEGQEDLTKRTIEPEGLQPDKGLSRNVESPSKITPNASVQASQVIAKKASIEWSSDEEEEDNLNKTMSPSGYDETSRASEPKDEASPLYATFQNSEHDISDQSVSNKDTPEISIDRSKIIGASPLSSHFSAREVTNNESLEEGGSHDRHETRSEASEEFPPETPLSPSFEASKRISNSRRDSPSTSHQGLDDNFHDRVSKDSAQIPLLAAEDLDDNRFSQELPLYAKQESKEQSSMQIPQGIESQEYNSPQKKTGPLQFIDSRNMAPVIPDGLEGSRQFLPNAAAAPAPTPAGLDSPGHSNGNSRMAEFRNRGSIKRASLDHENSKREIEVLMAEGTKMDLRITELEQENHSLSSTISDLQNNVKTYKDENQALQKRLEIVNKDLITAKTQVKALESKQAITTEPINSVTDDGHKQQFASLTNQLGSLSVENEELKQEVAELELKIKGLKSSNHNKDGKPVRTVTKSEMAEDSEHGQAGVYCSPLNRFTSPEGIIPLSLVVDFNSEIEQIFRHMHDDKKSASFGDIIFGDIARISDIVHNIIKLVDVPDNQKQILVIKASLSHAITATRFFALYHEILPFVTIESALSNIGFAVCSLLEVVKITNLQPQQATDEGQTQSTNPKTPTTSRTNFSFGASDAESIASFQDPRNASVHKVEDPVKMSPVKPLKITQKAVTNFAPSKPPTSTRKPSSTLFTSMLSPSLSNNSSPRNSAFLNLRSSSSGNGDEKDPITAEKHNETPANTQGHDDGTSASKSSGKHLDSSAPQSGKNSGNNPHSSNGANSLNSTVLQKQVVPTNNLSVSASQSFDSKKVSGGFKNDVSGAPNDNRRIHNLTLHDFSDDDSMDEEYGKRDDNSNTTSDDDVTYQALKQNMKKNHKAAMDHEHKHEHEQEKSKLAMPELPGKIAVPKTRPHQSSPEDFPSKSYSETSEDIVDSNRESHSKLDQDVIKSPQKQNLSNEKTSSGDYSPFRFEKYGGMTSTESPSKVKTNEAIKTSKSGSEESPREENAASSSLGFPLKEESKEAPLSENSYNDSKNISSLSAGQGIQAKNALTENFASKQDLNKGTQSKISALGSDEQNPETLEKEQTGPRDTVSKGAEDVNSSKIVPVEGEGTKVNGKVTPNASKNKVENTVQQKVAVEEVSKVTQVPKLSDKKTLRVVQSSNEPPSPEDGQFMDASENPKRIIGAPDISSQAGNVIKSLNTGKEASVPPTLEDSESSAVNGNVKSSGDIEGHLSPDEESFEPSIASRGTELTEPVKIEKYQDISKNPKPMLAPTVIMNSNTPQQIHQTDFKSTKNQSVSSGNETDPVKAREERLSSSVDETKPLIVKREFQSVPAEIGTTNGSNSGRSLAVAGKPPVAAPNAKGETGNDYEEDLDFDVDNFDIENPDNTLSELLLYLEHQTIEVISTIQSLLTSIKQPQASTGELRRGSCAITQVIAQMVEATSVSMAQSRNAPLKEHGNWVVQSLKDCQRRMTTLCRLNKDGSIEFDESDNDYADKHFKQRLAGIAFDVAKCTKELVKTVEEASLKEEIEYLNSKMLR